MPADGRLLICVVLQMRLGSVCCGSVCPSIRSCTAQVEKSLSVKGAVGAALFGFVDGFLSGMASEMRTAFEDPKCNSGNVKTKLKNVVRKFKAMWHQMKQLHKKTWTRHKKKLPSLCLNS